MAWSSVLSRGGGGSASRKVQVSGYSYLSEVGPKVVLIPDFSLCILIYESCKRVLLDSLAHFVRLPYATVIC